MQYMTKENYMIKRQVKAQMEIPGVGSRLEDALDDISDRLDDLEKVKESIDPAKETLMNIMFELRKDRIFHKGRHFTVTSPDIKPKLRVTKQKS
jgi:CII-binding regulator of phage lambda lysogenization HflD